MTALYAGVRDRMIGTITATPNFAGDTFAWFDITAASPQPQVGWTLNGNGDGVTFSPPPIAPIKAAMSAAIDDQLQAHYDLGCDYDFGTATATFEDGTTGAAHVQNIQTRDATDRTNWLILESVCNDMIAAGAGASPMPMAIRTASNAEVQLTASACKAFCTALKSNGAGKLAYSWTLKNAVKQAADQATLAAIDITAGWPS